MEIEYENDTTPTTFDQLNTGSLFVFAGSSVVHMKLLEVDGNHRNWSVRLEDGYLFQWPTAALRVTLVEPTDKMYVVNV